MPSFEEALETVLAHAEVLGTETVPLGEADGRILAAPLDAPFDLPAADNSAMDGYAVRASDCRGGATLAVAGNRPAGACAPLRVEEGQAVRIMTGAPIPEGADAVAPLEEVEERPEGAAGAVRIAGPVSPGAHVRRRGEDVPAGSRALPPGTTIRPPEIALLAAFGISAVEAYRRPRVAILSTGDELALPGSPLPPGAVYDGNGPALAAAVREAGGVPLPLGIARDDRDELRERMADGLRRADCLVTTAGVSGGDRDFVPETLAALGVRNRFRKVDIKPGRPTAFGVAGGKPVFSLPGNPVSALVTFAMFVRPAIRKMGGNPRPLGEPLRAFLEVPVRKKAGRLQLLRVTVRFRDGVPRVAPAGDQATGILGTLVRADGIALLPPSRTDFGAGEAVDLHLLYPGARP
jgi:molybdopterin molybdotransferase